MPDVAAAATERSDDTWWCDLAIMRCETRTRSAGVESCLGYGIGVK
jgi:hypothetical protein